MPEGPIGVAIGIHTLPLLQMLLQQLMSRSSCHYIHYIRFTESFPVLPFKRISCAEPQKIFRIKDIERLFWFVQSVSPNFLVIPPEVPLSS